MDIINLIEKEGKRRGLSENTIETYCLHVKDFLKTVSKEPKKITKRDIKDYLYCLSAKKLSNSSMNVALNALKFMAGQILFKTWKINIRFSKVPESLPTVLTKQETKLLIGCAANERHRLMLALMYSAGLRLSELVNLKAEDLSINDGYGYVRKGKGKKDRIFVIAENIKPRLIKWIKELSSGPYIFAGKSDGRISRETVYRMVKTTAEKAGIKKNVHPHTLRHSYATHLIENGYDLSTVQLLLGHNSPQTTKTYIHIASPVTLSVKSPYDSLESF